MKFDQLIKRFWKRGLMYGSELMVVDFNIHDFPYKFDGLSFYFKNLMIDRFESFKWYFRTLINIKYLGSDNILILNSIFAKIISVNGTLDKMRKLNIIRLYLLKTYRGRCQAMGKPSRSQSNRSNGWNAYNYNKYVRSFIFTIKKKFEGEFRYGASKNRSKILTLKALEFQRKKKIYAWI